ncbi:MAG: chromosome segregation protein SMC [Gammaproteobacteria bacterium]|nr:chromosome segregation protein SMC [Gammaproteobacteria bacterium]
MRLEKIKLAGFKSFVDPTTVPLPGNLVGVVGPNGCGKSNVIDAVRWVMGESSAKMLRGDSMADVIFNGSTSRKPVGIANIELIFDNTDGGAGGEYAKYNHISVKRVISRDGQSNYFMNGVRCRRRDITGLFLGTGLGPRSYSIIEQGMISRLIEARPEDLRAFLEEAAGISKYKERRRETQNRIDHTRDNLSRLNDLIDEITKQLEHLKRQAATAERYKEYKARERRLQAELLALRWHKLHLELSRHDQSISELETGLEAAIARQRRLEAEIDQERERHVEANEHFNQVQGRYYTVGGEVARVEQAIQFARETRARLEQELEQTEQAWQQSNEHRQQDESGLAQVSAALQEQAPRLEQLRTIEERAAERLQEAETAMHSWQVEWETFNRKAAEPAQTAQVERTRINHHEQQEESLQRRIEKLDDELSRLSNPQLGEEIAELESSHQSQQEILAEQEGELESVALRIEELRQENNLSGLALDAERERLQMAGGRLAALEALQEAALGKSGDSVSAWLDERGAAGAARLAQVIEVEAGWEKAAESVLGFHLQSVGVNGFDELARELDSLQSGALVLHDTAAVEGLESPPTNALVRRMKAPWPLQTILFGISTAENLEEALAQRNGLAPGYSIVTRDGIWLGKNWLRLSRDEAQGTGVLEREQEIRTLKDDIRQLENSVEERSAALELGRRQLRETELSRDDRQATLNQASRALSEIRSLLSGKRERDEHLRNRSEHVITEQNELKELISQGKMALEDSRKKLHAALEEMETLGDRRETLVRERDRLGAHLKQIREETSLQRAATQELALRVQSMRTSRDSLQQSLERMQGQISHLRQRREELKLGLEEKVAPLLEQSEILEVLLSQRLEVEAELSEARRRLEQIDTRLRELEQLRTGAEQNVQEQRNRRDQAKMARQEIKVRCGTLEEQICESGFQQDQLFRELPADASVERWQEEALRMDARIRRLGAINLAAIEEFQEQSERKTYLDSQHADISESLQTLENAIRKIDRETRTRFKETFDKVNTGLQEKFPRLFGGGHAYLQLTGEDLLDTGVTVMARPPGKRNSSIQLLSGGEKALTAVALVFAIFELNPAPFCMLDEVDAPLDDANVGRFCDMVKSMSDRVQFIFITHNKITMEIATHLMGVTMHEPGVSRLVSVDVEEAAQMAAM